MLNSTPLLLVLVICYLGISYEIQFREKFVRIPSWKENWDNPVGKMNEHFPNDKNIVLVISVSEC